MGELQISTTWALSADNSVIEDFFAEEKEKVAVKKMRKRLHEDVAMMVKCCPRMKSLKMFFGDAEKMRYRFQPDLLWIWEPLKRLTHLTEANIHSDAWDHIVALLVTIQDKLRKSTLFVNDRHQPNPYLDDMLLLLSKIRSINLQ